MERKRVGASIFFARKRSSLRVDSERQCSDGERRVRKAATKRGKSCHRILGRQFIATSFERVDGSNTVNTVIE